MKTFICFLCLVTLTQFKAYTQTAFTTKYGEKARYSISIPDSYSPKQTIGANIDLKFSNNEGASIITVVRNLPSGTTESDIDQLGYTTEQQLIDQLEATGMQNISLIKMGFITINGIKSFFSYYKDTELYYHSIIQFRKGKLINLLYTCEYAKKDRYMPYVYRVVNSLRT